MKYFKLILTFSVCLIYANQVFAAPVNVVATRLVQVGDIGGSFLGPNSSSTALGVFTDDLSISLTPNRNTVPAEAHQSSDINAGAGLLSGTGSVGVGFNAQQKDGVFANSIFDVTFDLALAHSFALGGVLNAGSDGGRAETLLQLFDSTNALVFDFDAKLFCYDRFNFFRDV